MSSCTVDGCTSKVFSRRLYGLASTLEARMFWRGRIRELEAQEKKLAPA